ncbi:MAG: tetratricopeptide repeat protein [Brevinema sp.]
MDMMTLSLMFLAMVVTAILGYYVLQFLWPQQNHELEIVSLFDQGEFEKIISITSSLSKYSNYLSIILYGARSRIKCEQYQDALIWFEHALLKIPSHHIDDRVFVELEIADIYTKLKQFNKADIHYRTAVSLKEDHVLANYKLAYLHFTQKNFESCRTILRTLLKKNPKLADARRLYAECLVELHLYPKAVRQYGLLARADEKIVSYNYAKALKALKIYERAAEVYKMLLEQNLFPEHREEMICDLAELYVILKLYPKGLGLIEQSLPNIKSTVAKITLHYIRANLFFQRGDKMIALQEYKNLHDQAPNYKDLIAILNLYGEYLQYPFLYHYFTSNESLFEQLTTSIVGRSSVILKRDLNYYIIQRGNNVHLFYRDFYKIPSKLQHEFDLVIRSLEDIDFLHVWSLNGMEGHYSLTGSSYRCVLRTGQDFLINIKDIVAKLEILEVPKKISFVQGVPDAPELVPIEDEHRLKQLLKDKNLESMINDDILNRAFDN